MLLALFSREKKSDRNPYRRRHHRRRRQRPAGRVCRLDAAIAVEEGEAAMTVADEAGRTDAGVAAHGVDAGGVRGANPRVGTLVDVKAPGPTVARETRCADAMAA